MKGWRQWRQARRNWLFCWGAVMPIWAMADPAMRCPPLDTPDALVEQRLVVFGEVHGTIESPAAVGAYVCQLANRHLPVRLGLELPVDLQAAIDRYMASDGARDAVASLLAHEFWHRSLQDGRSSRAMLALIEQMRRLRQEGADVALFAIDDRARPGPRDAAMAAIVREYAEAEPHARMVMLVGSAHAAKKEGNAFNAVFESMAYRLQPLHPVSLFIMGARQRSLTCVPLQDGTRQCGMRPGAQGLEAGNPVPSIELGVPAPRGFDGLVTVGGTTASPPAVDDLR